MGQRIPPMQPVGDDDEYDYVREYFYRRYGPPTGDVPWIYRALARLGVVRITPPPPRPSRPSDPPEANPDRVWK